MMRTSMFLFPFLALFAAGCAMLPGSGAAPDCIPPNLAPRAEIHASSVYSGEYAAANVADGKIGGERAGNDRGIAWCVQGETSAAGAEIVIEWPRAVRIAQLAYHGRTAFMLSECWKDYEVFVDDDAQPVAAGRFEQRFGPQAVTLEKPRKAKRLTLRFTSSHGGSNPGADEIQVFPWPVPEHQMPEMLAALRSGAPIDSLAVAADRLEVCDAEALGQLIGRMAQRSGEAPFDAARRRLPRVARGVSQARAALTDIGEVASPSPEAVDAAAVRADRAASAFEALSREVMLFDLDRVVAIRRHEIMATHVYTYHYEGFQAGGGLYAIDLHEDAPPQPLVETPEGQILDADISYDGRTVLFSWRRSEGEPYHVWAIDTDGSNLHQLTDGPWHDYNACWLPDGGIAFLSSRVAQFAYCWHAPVGIVWRMDADGSNPTQLSANYLNDFTPYPLDDGRIIYTRWEYVDRPAIPIQSLWTVNPDGTGLSVFYGNAVLSPGTFMEARSIPGTSRIVCTMTGHNGPTRGAIGIIDRSLGDNAQEAIRNITPDVPVPNVNEGNGNTGGSKLYSSPIPLDDMRFLVSARGPVQVRTFDGDCRAPVLGRPANGMQWFCTQPLRPRPHPPIIPSMKPPASDDTPAVVYLQDVYRGLAPHVEPGAVKRLRVVQEVSKSVRIDPDLRAFGFQFPVVSCGATYAPKRVLGEVPVQPDGSACFRLPPRTPVYFMVLDEEGRALHRMRSFTHLMPGERQGCIGCHESRRMTSTFGRGDAYLADQPCDLEPPEWGEGGFDYARVVQPVLDRHCARCHTGLEPAGGVDLSADATDFFNVSYETLARVGQGERGTKFVNWIPTYNGHEQNILRRDPLTWGSPRSRLADLVVAGHPDSQGRPRVDMPDADRRRILAWIDLNVPYYGTSETAHPGFNGCRRLYPDALDRVLAEVAEKRCATCHADGIPRKPYVRVEAPERNTFFTAPLARSAGGRESCGRAVFASREDPDYRAILAAFDPVRRLIAETPRMDMANAKPAAGVCRDRD